MKQGVVYSISLSSVRKSMRLAEVNKLATNIPSSLFLKSALKRFLGAVLLVYTNNIIRKGGSSKDG